MAIGAGRCLRACLAVTALACITACGFGDPTADYSHRRGADLVNEAMTGVLAQLDPKPVAPSPVPEEYAGGCEGLDGDAEGLTEVQQRYDLSVPSADVPARWLDQAHQYLTAHGYEIERSNTSPADLGLVAMNPETHIRVAMWRYPHQPGVSLAVQSGCVPEPGPS